MVQYLKKNYIELNASGMFSRLGDYLTGDREMPPFALHCEETGVFLKPVFADCENGKLLTWEDDKKTLKIVSKLTFDFQTRVISRRDTLLNISSKPFTIRRYLARFSLNRGEYSLYTQPTRWRHEFDSAWTKISGGEIRLSGREGRWCEGVAPFAILRDAYSRHALSFTVCPEGDWVMRFITTTESGKLNDMTVEAGLSDDRLALQLQAGESWEAPEVLIQLMPSRETSSGAALMSRYLNHRFPVRIGHNPVIYNSWLDHFNNLDVPRLEEQLKAAQACGCEIFIIDYGWYEDYHAFTRLDDWDECTDRAFFGKMREFSDTVRAAGLGFGFWVEFEFFSTKSKVVKNHPDWFSPSAHENIVYPKAWLPEVEDYLVESLANTIRRYNAVYVKNDMNHSQGYDPEHLTRYQKGIYRVMARLRQMLPEVVFDNCSSGSVRMTAGGMLENFDIHFISDNGNQIDNLHQIQSMMLGFPPGRILHWFVASEISKNARQKHQPSYFGAVLCPEMEQEGLVVQTQAATWDKFEPVDLNTALVANLTGVPGYSCDLASFSQKNRGRIKAANEIYKKYRDSLYRAEGHWLTPPEFFEKRTGWLGIQLSDPEKELHFMYIFHDPTNGDEHRIFRPEALDCQREYQVVRQLPELKVIEESVGGAELMERGVEVSFENNPQARIKAELILIAPAVKH